MCYKSGLLKQIMSSGAEKIRGPVCESAARCRLNLPSKQNENFRVSPIKDERVNPVHIKDTRGLPHIDSTPRKTATQPHFYH